MTKRIVIESHIPFVGNQLDGIAEVVRLAPEEITREAVADADALIVRTRTRCDASLLEGSRVGLVATATIGTDHIDKEYCRARGIEVVSAPGCNAPAVAQYVWASILSIRPKVEGLTIGIVGLGHVGTIVADWARRLGVRVLPCDPPREREEARSDFWKGLPPVPEPFVDLTTIAREADIITFHTPHTKEGLDPTHHLADEKFFNALERRSIVINAARGPIVATDAILRAIEAKKISEAVIDCWEGEPCISELLLTSAAIATPHIAGYSIEGKQRATAAALRAALRYFGAPAERIASITAPAAYNSDIHINPEAILASYNPLADTATLRAEFTPARFEQLRNTYPLRHELL